MTHYIGRFAPSPTGPLHLGSLVSALAGWLRARQADGEWHVRIEDVDPPRIAPGSSDAILASLEAHALQWDGPVIYQSQRQEAYTEATQQLAAQLFPCTCTRAELRAQHEQAGHGRYLGTCRNGIPATQAGRPMALRLRTPALTMQIDDLWQGPQRWFLPDARGDVVVQRADGIYTYPLAVVVDDAALGVTEVVRGFDLLEETPAQLGLQQALHLPQPNYAHHPLVMQDGQKLSKQNLATPLDNTKATENLRFALTALGAPYLPALNQPSELLDWALRHWDPLALRQHTAFVLDDPHNT
ncbi:MAG: tRNA glutamyl-Q(34) synthetase GluQRS [Gammaproteobacteria bacterium]